MSVRDLTKLFNRRFVYMDAGSGRFVTRAYALLHPLSTFAVPRHNYVEPME